MRAVAGDPYTRSVRSAMPWQRWLTQQLRRFTLAPIGRAGKSAAGSPVAWMPSAILYAVGRAMTEICAQGGGYQAKGLARKVEITQTLLGQTQANRHSPHAAQSQSSPALLWFCNASLLCL